MEAGPRAYLHVSLQGEALFQEFSGFIFLCLLTGQEPILKTMLNKIGDEIIVVNELLNKLELEIQYQEETNSLLKVMFP